MAGTKKGACMKRKPRKQVSAMKPMKKVKWTYHFDYLHFCMGKDG